MTLNVSGEIAPSHFQAGQVVAGRFKIVRLIGEGGMGAVFEANQITVDRRVALKVLRPDARRWPTGGR